ncbi:hypothetical protein TWF694_005295 [Orbilia ellipsospora]|uniref:LAGLIDADG endonuclease n=1 Tax=Orbilia ellipsospora TaxID=2528407 RepID=A0AAV9WSN1_9PEZI
MASSLLPLLRNQRSRWFGGLNNTNTKTDQIPTRPIRGLCTFLNRKNVAPIIIKEFKKASMNFTPSGTQFIKAAYNYKRLRAYRLSADSRLLLENLEKQWKVFPGRIDSLQRLFNCPGVNAIQNQHLWQWLQHLFIGGFLAREDVEHLPDPKPNLKYLHLHKFLGVV